MYTLLTTKMDKNNQDVDDVQERHKHIQNISIVWTKLTTQLSESYFLCFLLFYYCQNYT